MSCRVSCHPPLSYRNTYDSFGIKTGTHCIGSQLGADYARLHKSLFAHRLKNEKWKSQTLLTFILLMETKEKKTCEWCVIHLGIINCNEVFFETCLCLSSLSFTLGPGGRGFVKSNLRRLLPYLFPFSFQYITRQFHYQSHKISVNYTK